jgi:ribosomal protein S27E
MQRGSKRLQLAIPVRLKLAGGEIESRRTRDISLHGLSIAGLPNGEPGEPAVVQFRGYPNICEPFMLFGHVVRLVEDDPRGVAIRIDRTNTPPGGLEQYRKLVLHYVRHRPLLDEVRSGFFEGRCGACGWIGHVGETNPRCPKCGEEKIEPVTGAFKISPSR